MELNLMLIHVSCFLGAQYKGFIFPHDNKQRLWFQSSFDI